MAIEKHKLHNESAFNKRIAHLLYPVIFSLFSVLNAQGQEVKDTTNIPDQKIIPPTGEAHNGGKTAPNQKVIAIAPENAMDSVSMSQIEGILNKLIKPEFSDLEKQKIIKDIIQRLAFYFDDSEDPLKNMPKENMYINKSGMVQPLAWFLNGFYKESYRSAGKLAVDVKSIYEEKGKIYIVLEYVFIKDLNKKPEEKK